MSAGTSIEWCDATFNPWWGCQKVSPACDNCYAERDAKRFAPGQVLWGAGSQRREFGDKHWAEPVKWAGLQFRQCDACGARGCLEKAVGYARVCKHCGADALKPARMRVFCASMADVFDNAVPDEWRKRLFEVIRTTPTLDWLLLTKRIGNAISMVRSQGAVAGNGSRYLPENVWLGATVVNQVEANRDVPRLLRTRAELGAQTLFISVEPMLGPIDLSQACAGYMQDFAALGSSYLNQVICGGESGPGARPMHPDWARGLRDQCAAAGVAFLFKQWGEWCPRGPSEWGYPSVDGVPRFRMTDAGQDGQDLGSKGGNDVWMNRAGKKAAGRLLDGMEHNGFPS